MDDFEDFIKETINFGIKIEEIGGKIERHSFSQVDKNHPIISIQLVDPIISIQPVEAIG